MEEKAAPKISPNVELRKRRNLAGKKTGITGVSFCATGKWAGTYSACVTVKGICWAADGFSTIEEAAAAREEAKQEMIAKLGPKDPAYLEQVRKNWINIGKNGKKPVTVWYIRSPQGEKIRVCNMLSWAKENAGKFGKASTDRNANTIASAFAGIKRAYIGSRLYKDHLFAVMQYKGWSLDGWEDEYGEIHSTCGPPIRGDLLEEKKAALKIFAEKKRKENAEKYHEKSVIAHREAYHRKKAETGKNPNKIMGDYITLFGCKNTKEKD